MAFIEVIGGGFGGLQAVVLLCRLVDAGGRDSGREGVGHGYARVVNDLDGRKIKRLSGAESSETHEQAEYNECARHGEPPAWTRAFLYTQIEFENGKGQQVTTEIPEVHEGTLEVFRNSDRPPQIDDDPGKNADLPEPLRIRHEIGAQRPAAMRGDFMRTRRTPSQDGEGDNEQSVEDGRRRLNRASASAAHCFHIKAGDAEPQQRHYEHPTYPPVNGNGAGPYLRNELKSSTERYHRGQQSVRAEGQISSYIASDISHPEDGVLVPGLEVSRKGRGAIDGHNIKYECPLADDGHQIPKPDGSFQGGVRNRI